MLRNPDGAGALRPWELILGGFWVVTNGVRSLLIWVLITVTLLITPLKTTHEPPSRAV